MKVLVCGAAGFIGRHIAETLASKENYEVYGTYFNSSPLQNPKIRMLWVDLTNKQHVKGLMDGMDVVVQAAATTTGSKDTIERPYHHVTDNAVMNSLIFREAFESKVSHVIFFSCSTMYQSSNVPVKEIDFNVGGEIPPNYFGVGWTKVYLEKMCEFYSRLGVTDFTVIRHSNIYGQYDKFDLERSHVFGATVAKVMDAEDGGEITVWGDGSEGRDLLYVSDLVDFVELAMANRRRGFELFNVGSGQLISVRELVEKIISISGKNLRIKYDEGKPQIKTSVCLDTLKARQRFGWTQKVSLDEGIERTLKWYKTNYGGC